MKIIALIPFRNEEWALPTCLSSLKGFCDEIICVDDFSTDNSKNIALSFGCKVYDNLKPENVGWSEHSIRERLLNLGRDAGGTHFVCIDADEAITSQFAKNARSILEILKPGQKISMQWLAMWKSLDHFRNDNSVWSNNFKDFIVYDDKSAAYDYKWLHVGRTPGPNNDETLVRLRPDYGAVMHFQFSNWTNFQIKQCYLRCAELVKKPETDHLINQHYAITLDDAEVYLAALPPGCFSNLPMPDMLNTKTDWRIERIQEYFEKFGPAHFSKLNIWHVPEIRRLAVMVARK
jgi:glycosyltransferase involved in cell wall biosynthesis